jgi:hypothetical protein
MSAPAKLRVLGLGVDYRTGELLFPGESEQAFKRAVEAAGREHPGLLRAPPPRPKLEVRRRPGLAPPVPTVNLSDPVAAGWTYVVAKDDPDRDAYIEAIRPLAELRGMAAPSRPVDYTGGRDWRAWYDETFVTRRGKKANYVLLVGEPDRLPFELQSFLEVAGSAGRLAFDRLEDLGTYVEKVCRLESGTKAPSDESALFFGPERPAYGRRIDPTHFSRRYLVEPLAEETKGLGLEVDTLVGEDATKDRLVSALTTSRASVVFTASHGAIVFDEGLAEAKRINGAIECQLVDGAKPDYFGADDVPTGGRFLEGAVWFQFACYGYGTPAKSGFAHWGIPIRPENASGDFVASLPRRLLAHPRGPVAFIGHLDVSLIHGFRDPSAPEADEELKKLWNPRLNVFMGVIRELVGSWRPAGLALEDMNDRSNQLNQRIAAYFDRRRRGLPESDAAGDGFLVQDFLMRSDAANYLTFGDPAARALKD